MELFRLRPLCLVCSVLVVSSLLAVLIPVSVVPWLSLSLSGVGAVTVFFCLKAKAKRRLTAGVAVIVASLALFLVWIRVVRTAAFVDGFADREVVTEASVCDFERFGDTALVTFRIHQTDGVSRSFLARSYVRVPLEVGDRVRLSGSIVSALSEKDVYLLADGCAAQIEAKQVEVIGHDRFWRKPFVRIKDACVDSLESAASADESALYSALLFGVRERLPAGTQLAFRRLGIGHLLALSGLHLSVLCGFLLLFLRRVCPYRVVNTTVTAVFALGYCAVCGASVSLMRAVFMLVCVTLSRWCRAQSDAVTDLSLAAALLVLISPYSVFDCSFWLSCLSCLGILTIAPSLPRRSRKERFSVRVRRVIFVPVALTAAAMLCTIMAVSVFFGEFSALAIPANVLLSPVIGVCLLFAVPLLILSPVPMLGVWIGKAGDSLARLVLTCVHKAASIHGIVLSLDHPVVLSFVVCLAAACGYLLCCARKHRKRAIAALLSCAVLFVVSCTTVHLIRRASVSLGYHATPGTDVVVLAEDHRAFCVAAASCSRSGAAATGRLLKAQHVYEVETLVLAKADGDAAEYVSALLDQVRVDRVLLPEEVASSPAFSSLIALAGTANCQIGLYAPTDLLALGSGTLCCFESKEEEAPDVPDAFGASLVWREVRLFLFSSRFFETPGFRDAFSLFCEADTLICASHDAEKRFSMPIMPANRTVVLSRPDMTPEVDEQSEEAARNVRFVVAQEWIWP